MQKIAKALGLPETATESDIIAAIEKAKTAVNVSEKQQKRNDAAAEKQKWQSKADKYFVANPNEKTCHVVGDGSVFADKGFNDAKRHSKATGIGLYTYERTNKHNETQKLN